jgi:hypothetical protein
VVCVRLIVQLLQHNRGLDKRGGICWRVHNPSRRILPAPPRPQ